MDFDIMNRDECVAKWENRQFTLLKSDLAPLYLVRTGNVEHWLETRAIDEHRANSRLLKKALHLTERDDISTVMSVNAVTITDNYWVKPPGSDLIYDDVRFDNDYFANLALRGEYGSFNKAANSNRSRTPELTNIGSFEKCWKLIDGEWWMYKKADHNQQFSEIFIYELGRILGFSMAEYMIGDKCVKTRDFTDNAAVNFESAYSFMDDKENYIAVVEKLREIAPHTIPDYVKMVFLDTIVANPDRHTNNFGLLRDVETGKVLSLAPNFDNNIALISRGYPGNIERKNDVLVKFFNQLLEFDPLLIEHVPKLEEQDIRKTLKLVNMKVKSDVIVRFIMNGYNQIARDK
ncbi:MAG: hypothetical protein PHN99_06585 [Eubacteriales bacterium]|nr:hypothetical protein [Eubacteriales bacterium]MDD4328214.1 hypothetical protein [Eubacteriales bacterium]MDD4717765.1 hypothetical protein [Eubacteriales bacterium]